MLLEHATGWSAARRIAGSKERAASAVRERFAGLVARRSAAEPVAYIVGEREFYSLCLAVDRRVLVPRPETEHVVEQALRELDRLGRGEGEGRSPVADRSLAPSEGGDALGSAPVRASGTGAPGACGPDTPCAAGRGERSRRPALKESPRIADIEVVRVVDVGTGSGAIALALATATKAWLDGSLEIVALDRADGALAVARDNARRLGLADRIRFLRADLIGALADGSVDLVVSNPPYLSEDDLAAAPRDLDFEPREALYGGDVDGLGVFRELVNQARRTLRPGGVLVSEIGAAQGPMAMTIAKKHGFRRVAVSRDLAGLDRVVVARTPA